MTQITKKEINEILENLQDKTIKELNDLEEELKDDAVNIIDTIIKTKKTRDVENDLKFIQKNLYVMGFTKYKSLIETIDKYVEDEKSVNHNEIIFTKNYYEKKIIFEGVFHSF